MNGERNSRTAITTAKRGGGKKGGLISILTKGV